MALEADDIRDMVKECLGADYDEAKLNQLEGIQQTVWDQNAVLWISYEAGKLTLDQYVDLFNGATSLAFLEMRKILGMKDYRKIFGQQSTKVNLLDKETFRKAEVERKR